jgi:hypothetical protein
MQSLIEHLLIDIQVLALQKYGVVPLTILIGLKKGFLAKNKNYYATGMGFILRHIEL